jgi:hypothetical protein
MTDFHSLCIRLIIATDADNAKAQAYIISQIRLALHQEYGGFMNENEEQQLSTQERTHCSVLISCHDKRA